MVKVIRIVIGLQFREFPAFRDFAMMASDYSA
jgi:hypothetical protein